METDRTEDLRRQLSEAQQKNLELASMLGLDSKQVIQEAREEVGRDPKRNWDDEIKALGEHVRRFCRGR